MYDSDAFGADIRLDATGHDIAEHRCAVSLRGHIDAKGDARRLQQQGYDNGSLAVSGERRRSTERRAQRDKQEVVAAEACVGDARAVAIFAGDFGDFGEIMTVSGLLLDKPSGGGGKHINGAAIKRIMEKLKEVK